MTHTASPFVFIGPCKSGKTSLVWRIRANDFYPTYKTTMHSEFFSFSAKQIPLRIIDTPGYLTFRDNAISAIKNNDNIVLVLDITQLYNFELDKILNEWLSIIDTARKAKFNLYVIGNKLDLLKLPVSESTQTNFSQKVSGLIEKHPVNSKILKQTIFATSAQKPANPDELHHLFMSSTTTYGTLPTRPATVAVPIPSSFFSRFLESVVGCCCSAEEDNRPKLNNS